MIHKKPNIVVASETSAEPHTSAPAVPQVIVRCYTVHCLSVITARRYEIRENGLPLLWATEKAKVLSMPEVTIHESSPDGPIIATSRSRALWPGLRIFVGDPEGTSKEDWAVCEPHGLRYSQWSFPAREAQRNFIWKRTHNNELGASHLSFQDFKLVDEAQPSTVLATYIRRGAILDKGEGTFTWFVNFDRNTELAAMVTMLGINETIRREGQ